MQQWHFDEQQHGQHLSGQEPLLLLSHLSAAISWIGGALWNKPLPPPPRYSMTIHQLLFSSYTSGWASLENSAQCPKSGKETLKINQCWYMEVRPDKGVDQCIQILPAKTKASFYKDKLSLWRHALPQTALIWQIYTRITWWPSGSAAFVSGNIPLYQSHQLNTAGLMERWDNPSLWTRKRNSWTHSRKQGLPCR